MDRIDAIMGEMRKRGLVPDPAEANPRPPASHAPERTAPRPKKATPKAVTSRKRLVIFAATALTVALVLPTIVNAARDAAAQAKAGKMTPTTQASTPAWASATPSASASTAPEPTAWTAVVQQLDVARGRALVSRSIPQLASVDVQGSPALTADRAIIQRLLRHEWHVDGYPMRVLSVSEQYLAQDAVNPRAVLTVVDELDAYRILDAKGAVISSVPARGRVTWRVEVRRAADNGWRFMSAQRTTRAKQ